MVAIRMLAASIASVVILADENEQQEFFITTKQKAINAFSEIVDDAYKNMRARDAKEKKKKNG